MLVEALLEESSAVTLLRDEDDRAQRKLALKRLVTAAISAPALQARLRQMTSLLGQR
jgi:hypothetical protein